MATIRIETWEDKSEKTLEETICDIIHEYDVKSIVAVIPTEYTEYCITNTKVTQVISKASIVVKIKKH